MSRGRTPEIVIKGRAEPKPNPELTLEERILNAAEKFRSEKSRDVERLVLDTLEHGYKNLLLQTVGFEDDWSRGLRFTTYSDTGKELKEKAKRAAERLVDAIDFSQIELTQGQVNAIKSAYQAELKRYVADAARDLAQEDARRVAAKVLNIPLED